MEWRSVHATDLVLRASQHLPFYLLKQVRKVDIKTRDNRSRLLRDNEHFFLANLSERVVNK